MDTAAHEQERTARIRSLNDALRVRGEGGEIVLTRGVAARSGDFIATAFRAVADFDVFTEGNDPYGEHDFGAVTVEGVARHVMLGRKATRRFTSIAFG